MEVFRFQSHYFCYVSTNGGIPIHALLQFVFGKHYAYGLMRHGYIDNAICLLQVFIQVRTPFDVFIRGLFFDPKLVCY